MDFRQEFIRFTIEHKVLRFGEFKTKAGRLSPYFFDAGLFYDGAALKRLPPFSAEHTAGAGVVISAGTAVRESVNLIRASNAIPCGVAIALDRMERGSGTLSAVQQVG